MCACVCVCVSVFARTHSLLKEVKPLSVCLSDSLSVCLSVSVCLCLCLSVCLSVCLSLCGHSTIFSKICLASCAISEHFSVLPQLFRSTQVRKKGLLRSERRSYTTSLFGVTGLTLALMNNSSAATSPRAGPVRADQR